eukprot:TRINITY_DN3056_c0_g2_i1.p1 TRINITY_DN3056_c0_g2~~TRINITY_DN3056_c0_g2_i1.p1  ORF type:complete len:723 (+),score=110.16 TRINITY_DN3056_c0_g2_i1:186-2171(+)
MTGIFLSTLEPESLLGLPGMLLTLRETERSRSSEDGMRSITKAISLKGEVPIATKEGAPISICGPEGISGLLDSMLPFLKVPGFYSVLEPPSTQPEQFGVFSNNNPAYDINAIVTYYKNGEGVRQVLQYSIDIPEQPGKFLAEKAQALGVMGKKRAILKSGTAVESDTIPGRMVQPHEVLGKAVSPVSVLVLSVVAGYEKELMQPILGWVRSKIDAGITIRGIYHLGGPEVNYEFLFEEFSSVGIQNETHIRPVENQSHTVFQSSALHHDRLVCMAPELFNHELFSHPRMRLPELHLLPIAGSDVAMPDHPALNRDFDMEKEREAWPDDLKKLLATSTTSPDNFGFPKVSMLGTGGMMPSKYRNVTSQMIELSSSGDCILLDAGEGTLGQIRRIRDVKKFLLNLRFIFLSHIHADHHVGVASILYKRALLLPNDPILVIGPTDLTNYLHVYSQSVNLSYKYVHCEKFQDPAHSLLEMSDLRIQTIPVDHCSDSWGCVVQVRNGEEDWKVCFSGDTRPCDALVAAGKDCNLLIHEATFEDDKKEDAVCKKHSCVTEALHSAKDMNANETLLTHFSQRYPKVPPPMETDNLKAGLAFDLMTVSLPNSSPLEILNQRLSILTEYFASLDDAKKQNSKIQQAKIRKEKQQRQERAKKNTKRKKSN